MNPLNSLGAGLVGAVGQGIGALAQAVGNDIWKPQADPAALNPSMPKTPVTQQLPPWMHSPVPQGNVAPYKPGPSILEQFGTDMHNTFQNASHMIGQIVNPDPITIPIHPVQQARIAVQRIQPQQVLAATAPENWNAQTPVMMQQAIPAQESAPMIQQYMQEIAPQSPMATPGATMWMAQAAEQNHLNPYLLPTIAKVETNALQPGLPGQTQLAAAIAGNNPFNVLINGQEFNYGGLQNAINRYAEDIASRWQGDGWARFRQNPILQNYVLAQNPTDNPNQELQNMISLLSQHTQQRFAKR